MPSGKKSPKRKATVTARGEVTRAKLIEVAYEQFNEHGFHGASMRHIAEAAGVAVGGIYNHYRSKEEIFAAVLDAYHPYHVIMPALESIPDDVDTMEGFMREVARKIYAGV